MSANTTPPHTSALHSAAAIVAEAADLAGFLAGSGDDLDAQTANDAAALLAGVRQVLAGIVARIEAAGPGES